MNEKLRIAVIGCGNWGSTIAKVIAENILDNKQFDQTLTLWVHEEESNNTKLSKIINETHTNPIYLPGIQLPKNIHAVTALGDLDGFDIYVFCVPHQFVSGFMGIKTKKGSFAINLGKGLIPKEGELYAPSEYISEHMKIDCCCLMGANIANEVAREQLCETTIGYTKEEQVFYLRVMFEGPYFKPTFVEYNRGLEICGSVKNVISIAYGILSEGECNTKAMLFRRGLQEMKYVCEMMGGEFDALQSASVGDLLTSCLCGRNFKCGIEIGNGKSVEEIESGMNGQKLQGPSTAKMLHDWFIHKNFDMLETPIISAVYDICFKGADCSVLYEYLKR